MQSASKERRERKKKEETETKGDYSRGEERSRGEIGSSFVTGNPVTPSRLYPAIAKHPVRAQRNTGEERRTDTPVESGRSSRANHATRQSTQLDDSSGREHSFATATISSFRMTRYYKTPACATRLLHGGPKAAIHMRAREFSPESNPKFFFLLLPVFLRDEIRNRRARIKFTFISTISPGVLFFFTLPELPLLISVTALLFR